MNAKSFGIAAALCVALVAASAANAQMAGAELAPQFRWKPVPVPKWKTQGGAKIENGILTVSCAEPGTAYAEAELDLSEYDGKAFELAAVFEGKGVGGKTVPHGGFTLCVSYLDVNMGGNRTWPMGPKPTGDFGPAEIVFTDRSEKVRGKPVVMIGLDNARGEVRCDLSTLRVREPQPLLPLRNRGRGVNYPERIGSMPQARGVSICPGITAEEWDKLVSWGVKIVRCHMDIPRNKGGSGTAANFEEYAERYRSGVEPQLDQVAKHLDEAHARGIKVVIAGHTVGGGCSASAGDPPSWQGDGRMFHDKRYADLFVWYWEQVAKRFAGRAADIYGYDLLNEGHHLSPAIEGGNRDLLMERTARAIRAIDPEATIIVESMYGDPGWFRSLSAIDLDNVIYSVHCYYPHDFTHQGIYETNAPAYKWPDESRGWNRDFIRRHLQPVVDFRREHGGARILVGEFSAIAWAEGADQYLRDSISVFEELGFDWIYHEFGGWGWKGWNVEVDVEGRGKEAKYTKAEDTPRKRALLDGLARWKLDWSAAGLAGSLGRDNPFFAPGEEMAFSLTLEGFKGELPPDTFFIDWTRRGDDGITEKGRAPLPLHGEPVVIRTKMDSPGFVSLTANVVTEDGKLVRRNHRWEPSVCFTGGAAVAPETLEPGTEPADYDEFWNAQMARLAEVPVKAELKRTPCRDAGVRLYAVSVACAGGRPVTGWLTVPADASASKRYPAQVWWRGASREDQPAPSGGPHDRIFFHSNGHGFELGKGTAYVEKFFNSVEKRGMTYGFDPDTNEHREDSYWLGMILRAVRAVQWVETLPEWNGKDLTLSGGSQGGWNALHAAAHCPRATNCSVGMVWGCDWTGQAERGRMKSVYRPDCWFPDMAYFAPVFAARRIRCPVRIDSAGLGDYVSPPSSQAVLYNELRVPKQILWCQGWSHGGKPAGMAKFMVDDGYAAATAKPDGK